MASVVIKAVADDEFVGDWEAGPVGLDGDFPLAALLQEDADFDVGSTEVTQALDEGGEGVARVEDVVHNEDVTALEGLVQGVETAQATGTLRTLIAGETDTRNFRVGE